MVKKIINIEDSVGKAWDIKRALEWNGYPEVDLATNAETGIAMIEKAIADGEAYDLLITDMHFLVNGVDDTKAGLYVIEELRRKGIEIQIIVCSSIRYNIPGIEGCIFYNKSRDLNWDFREVLGKLS